MMHVLGWMLVLSISVGAFLVYSSHSAPYPILCCALRQLGVLSLPLCLDRGHLPLGRHAAGRADVTPRGLARIWRWKGATSSVGKFWPTACHRRDIDGNSMAKRNYINMLATN